jgi:hypothetical protein
MKYPVKPIILLVALASCSGLQELSFSCRPSDYVSKYRTLNGFETTYQTQNDLKKYRMWSERSLDPDHDPRDPADLDLLRDQNSIMFSYYILIDKDMFKKNKWGNEHVSCYKIKNLDNEILSRCKNSGYVGEVEFRYSKKQGIISMEHICRDCSNKDKEILISKYGLGKPCD